MSEKSLSVCPTVEPCACAVIGLGIGYILAPRKYSLQHLLTLKKDVFEKIYTDDLVKNMNEEEKQALHTLQRARLDFKLSKTTINPDIKETACTWKNLFNKIEVPKPLTDAYTISRKNLQQAIRDTNYTELYKEYRKAKSDLKNNPSKQALKVKLSQANKKLSKSKAILNPLVTTYKDCVANLRKDRLQKIKSGDVKYVYVRDSYHKFIKALATRRTVASNKLFNLTNDKKIIESYKLLSSYLPKARTRAALNGAGLLGFISFLIMLTMKTNQKIKLYNKKFA